ncbi:MAG: BatD family protein, partial [Gammaproteobacteria bacterium]|nr:BatD family protein [Gammaproteobacteria bacterium]
MVRRWMPGICLLALLVSGHSLSAAELALKVDVKEVQHGKLFRAILSTDQQQRALALADLSSLEERFVIHRLGDISTQGGGQQRSLWLIPREAGRQTIPAVMLGRMRSQALSLDVAKAIDDKTGEPIQIQFDVDTTSPVWPRQQLLYRVQLQSDDPYVDLEVERLRNKDLRVYEMAQQTDRNETSDGPMYRHTAGWAIFAPGPGQYAVELPEIRYGREGIVSHRFFAEPIELQVQALPGYLSANLPVGEIKLDSDIGAMSLAVTSNLQVYQLRLTARGVPKIWLPDYLSGLGNNTALNPYQLDVQTVQGMDRDGVFTEQRIRLPLSFRQSGWHFLGPLDLRYLNPGTRKLEGSKRQLRLPIALHPWQMTLSALILLLLAMLLARWNLRLFV